MRVRDEVESEYVGPVSGLAIQPHENCEPFRLEFDQDLYLQEYTKTQFAPVEVHIALVELLDRLSPHFEALEVIDEAEYFESRDVTQLKSHFAHCFELLETYLSQPESYEGPIRPESKRIVDVVSQG